MRNAAANFDALARRRIGTEMIAAATPMRTSVRAKVTSDCTTTRSHAAISPSPPARAGPATAAIVGTGAVHQPLQARRRSARESAGPVRRSLRSAPAQNTGGVWSTTTTRTLPSAMPRSARSSAA